MGERAAAPAWLCAALLGLASCHDSSAAEPGKGGAGQAGVMRLATWRVSGRVNAVYRSVVVVEDESGRWHRLQVGPDTAVRKDGQGSSLLELQQGERVEAHCTRDDGVVRAIELHVSESQQ
jgi:hypothetical protein